jgi:hypothetical protein
MEAEYIAASTVVDEIVWMRRLLETLKCGDILPTVLYIDNQSAIKATQGEGKSEKRKHIDVKHHAIVEKVEQGVISPKYIPSTQNEADIFTKALVERLYAPLVEGVMGERKNQIRSYEVC